MKSKMLEDFLPSEKTILKMMGEYPGVNIQYEKEKFIDYYLSSGGVSANWDATFRNWIRRADEYERRRGTNQSTHVATGTTAVSDRRTRILSVAKQGDTDTDGKIKRFPKRK